MAAMRPLPGGPILLRRLPNGALASAQYALPPPRGQQQLSSSLPGEARVACLGWDGGMRAG